MMIFIRIAFRNLLKNKKRSILIGLTLIISCILLLMSYAIGNGIGQQIIQRFRAAQSGDVTVVWSKVKEIDPSDPSRLFFSEYEIKKDLENKVAIDQMHRFLQKYDSEIDLSIQNISNTGMMDTGKYASYCIINGITQEELDFLTKERIFELVSGYLPFVSNYGICISDQMANKYNLQIGDWVILDANTAQSFVNTLDYQVVGVYKSSSDFDSIYIYMTRENALELFDQESEYFKTLRIYLKNPAEADDFAKKLDDYLLKSSDVLRAESLNQSSQFFNTIASFQKNLFSIFVIFILFIIAIGIRSTVRMNLFERTREFGTLRTMGFNRIQIFLIVFLEILLLALISLGIAFSITLLLVFVLKHTGIHIGYGAIAFALGGEYIYPEFVLTDTLTALLILTIFSLFAPLKPGLRLCYQNITDLLAQNQKSISALRAILKNYFKQRKLLKITHSPIRKEIS